MVLPETFNDDKHVVTFNVLAPDTLNVLAHVVRLFKTTKFEPLQIKHLNLIA